MATDTGPFRASASCKDVSFPAGISTKPSQVEETDFRRNLQAAWSWKNGNASQMASVTSILLCQRKGRSAHRQYPCCHGHIWRRYPSNPRCIRCCPNWSNNRRVVVHSNWPICLMIEHGDFPKHRSTNEKHSTNRRRCSNLPCWMPNTNRIDLGLSLVWQCLDHANRRRRATW